MNALLYLIRMSIKNWLRGLVKKPATLVLYLLLVAMLIGLAIMLPFVRAEIGTDIAPIFWVRLILFAFFGILMVICIVKGLSGGDAIFEMNDVNFLFVSPISPRIILSYGVIRMMKTAFAAGFFIVFQEANLGRFGIGFSGILLIFSGFIVTMVVMLTVSLLIYYLTNGKPRVKTGVKYVTALMFVPLVMFFAASYLTTKDALTALEAAAASPLLTLIPVTGWTAAGIVDILTANILPGLGYLALDVLLFAGVILYIIKTNPDYYEDVLVATETAFERKRSIADGNINAAASGRGVASVSGTSKRAVMLKKTGISGTGAAAIFGKHTREIIRENRFGYLTLSSIIVAACGILYSVITRSLVGTLITLMWVQIFLIGTGKGLRETYSHYIYLIPESSFRKIIWNNMEIMARTLIECVLLFTVSGVILRVDAVEIITCVTGYMLFSYMLLGVNYLSMRYLGADLSNGLLLLFYFLGVIIAIAPGVAGAIFIWFSITDGIFASWFVGSGAAQDIGIVAGLWFLAVWEFFVGTVFFTLSKGVLHNCDMSVMKIGK